MAAFEWQDSYSIGIDALDDQHKVLIDMINYLDTVEREGGDLTEVLQSLNWYVQKHFALEESMMQEANYPDLGPHAAKHREFESWLHSAQSDMADDAQDKKALAKSINEHLKDWLAHHILVADMDYKGKIHAPTTSD